MNDLTLRLLILAVVFLVVFLLPIRVAPRKLMGLAFFLWFMGGLVLAIIGFNRLAHSVQFDFATSEFLAALIAAVAIGVAKGKFILTKTSKRNIERISGMSDSARLSQVYSIRSWIVIGVMIGISVAMTLFGVDPYWRGIVNLAVGFGLMASSFVYLKPTVPAQNV